MTPEDRIQIEALMFRYARCVDTADYATLGQLFADGEITSNKSRPDGRPGMRGAEQISTFYATTNKSHGEGGKDGPLTHHIVTNVEYEKIASDEVTVRSCFVVYQATPKLPLQPIVCGRYRDVFQLNPDGWAFRSKFIEVTLVGNISEHLSIAL